MKHLNVLADIIESIEDNDELDDLKNRITDIEDDLCDYMKCNGNECDVCLVIRKNIQEDITNLLNNCTLEEIVEINKKSNIKIKEFILEKTQTQTGANNMKNTSVISKFNELSTMKKVIAIATTIFIAKKIANNETVKETINSTLNKIKR